MSYERQFYATSFVRVSVEGGEGGSAWGESLPEDGLLGMASALCSLLPCLLVSFLRSMANPGVDGIGDRELRSKNRLPSVGPHARCSPLLPPLDTLNAPCTRSTCLIASQVIPRAARVARSFEAGSGVLRSLHGW